MTRIVSLAKLLELLNESIKNTNKGKGFVLVTGCFDILHPAHINFLKTAKKQGDFLILGLEADKRVKQLKGKKRPVNTYVKRSQNLAELNLIDFIFHLPENFNSQNRHLELLQLIKPKVLALSENTPFLKKKKELIEKTNGKLFIFPYNSKYSTTKLLTNR